MKQLHTQHVDHLEQMYLQVKEFESGLLLSGLTVLVKDTASYVTAEGVDSEIAEGFRMAYMDMLNQNRYYWERFGPELYCPLSKLRLPEGFARDAANCKANLNPLAECVPQTEWLRAPGWHFFQTYTRQRKNDILRGISLKDLRDAFCEGRNPYDDKAKDSCNAESSDPYKPIEGLVERLSESDRQWTAFWHPMMLYLVLLLHATNFITLE